MNDRLGNTTLSIWEYANAVMITTDANDQAVVELNTLNEVEVLICRLKVEAEKAFGEVKT